MIIGSLNGVLLDVLAVSYWTTDLLLNFNDKYWNPVRLFQYFLNCSNEGHGEHTPPTSQINFLVLTLKSFFYYKQRWLGGEEIYGV